MNLNEKIVKELGITTGSTIKILNVINHPELKNKTGVVRTITRDYQLQGTWGNVSIIPSTDKIVKVN